MADYPGDLVPLYAYLSAPLPHLHERVLIDPSKPSGVRVFGKSMHILAVGWTLAVAWLWMATVQHPLRIISWPRLYSLETVAGGILPALLMVVVGWIWGKYARRAPYRELERREWRHAIWWCFIPNVLLVSTVWVMLRQ